MKTSELTGAALDWAVAKSMGGHIGVANGDVCFDTNNGEGFNVFTPSTDWAQGGPIIEREGIYLWRPYGVNGAWSAKLDVWPAERVMHDDKPLIAAMRCYVASKLGDEVDVPDELI